MEIGSLDANIVIYCRSTNVIRASLFAKVK